MTEPAAHLDGMTHTMMDDTHLAGWLAESAACEPTAWDRWIDRVEALLGHSTDGDFAFDGFALDTFYDNWKSGQTPEQAVAVVKAHPRYIGGLRDLDEDTSEAQS